ncbi:hypothetical protein [Paenibacillus illinoisensis]|uniref:hypothetical protein n=1 Tax=Paenibacillus illinoisensis TaxID=59845 RepID=UPI00301C6D44
MQVVEFHGTGKESSGQPKAGTPVMPISDLLEATTLRVDEHPMLLASGAYVLATDKLVGQDPLIWHEESEEVHDWNQLQISQVHDRMLEPTGLQLYRVELNDGEESRRADKHSKSEWNSELLRSRLLQFRTELCRAGLEQVRQHLSARISGGQSTFQHQLVKGMVADILTTLYMTETWPEDQLLSVKPDLSSDRVHAWMHEELDEAFRQIQRLGGGFGYLRQGVSAYIYAGQLVKNLLLAGKGDHS